MDDMYRAFILDHYRHPHHFGAMEDFTFESEGVNPMCGDEIKVQVLVDDADCVADVRFSGNGCAISQAAMSILSDELIGKGVVEVAALKREDIVEMLGIELSPVRLKCALLGLTVLKVGLAENTGTELPQGWEGLEEIAWERR